MTVSRLLRFVAAALLAAAGFASAQPARTDEVLGARLTPELREALRERWMEERRRRMEGGHGSRMGEGMPHRLTPEQRRQLREQIREADREWRVNVMRRRRGER